MVRVSLPRSGHRSPSRSLPKLIKAPGQIWPPRGVTTTLRGNTERPATLTIGINKLIGTNTEKLPPALARLKAKEWKKGAIPPKWDGKAAERIVEHLERLLLAS